MFALILVGYFALEGANIGVGVLLPVLGRGERERARLVSTLGPLVLVGEVWLVAVAGLLFGAFPSVEGHVLPALYPLVVVLLLGWVVRDAGVWFRRRATAPAWRLWCDGLVVTGSITLAFTWGLILYALLVGLHRQVLSPAGILLGLAVTALLAVHGLVFAASKTRNRAATLIARRLGPFSKIGVTGFAAVLPALVMVSLRASHLLDNAAPDGTLSTMAWIALPVVPLIAAAQWWAWRAFTRPATVQSFF
ncbi:cytochrome d ubiquinol oxidase subunit II [Micromonospora sp. NPDC050200]|uniref:cytochrome d ubiquinol oxidase subunit II n=1 Tax=Micromonospora sp. NPDC050200 TaxID=3155664 RepID=UPI003408718C